MSAADGVRFRNRTRRARRTPAAGARRRAVSEAHPPLLIARIRRAPAAAPTTPGVAALAGAPRRSRGAAAARSAPGAARRPCRASAASTPCTGSGIAGSGPDAAGQREDENRDASNLGDHACSHRSYRTGRQKLFLRVAPSFGLETPPKSNVTRANHDSAVALGAQARPEMPQTRRAPARRVCGLLQRSDGTARCASSSACAGNHAPAAGSTIPQSGSKVDWASPVTFHGL